MSPSVYIVCPRLKKQFYYLTRQMTCPICVLVWCVSPTCQARWQQPIGVPVLHGFELFPSLCYIYDWYCNLCVDVLASVSPQVNGWLQVQFLMHILLMWVLRTLLYFLILETNKIYFEIAFSNFVSVIWLKFFMSLCRPYCVFLRLMGSRIGIMNTSFANHQPKLYVFLHLFKIEQKYT